MVRIRKNRQTPTKATETKSYRVFGLLLGNLFVSSLNYTKGMQRIQHQENRKLAFICSDHPYTGKKKNKTKHLLFTS